jgi:hypothetical protein
MFLSIRHAAYRKNTREYAGGEGRLWEELHHGFILGAAQFTDVIKETFLPETPHREMPRQKQMSADLKEFEGFSLVRQFLFR